MSAAAQKPLPQQGQTLHFFKHKCFTYIRPLGHGGTGSTHLVRDEESGLLYAIKKYSPIPGNDRDECYKRFIDEGRLLIELTHPNIVRVYDCYLYPNELTGFLQMEYIDGVPIDQFNPRPETKSWNEIFSDAVSAFEEMERKSILHRDIRPANVLVDASGNIKIIDFGFGKHYLSQSTLDNNSVVLNWPGTEPMEISAGIYNQATEIYYLGKLFQSVIAKSADSQFEYQTVIDTMSNRNPAKRYYSFSEVRQSMSDYGLSDLSFDMDDTKAYQAFADNLMALISEYIGAPILETKADNLIETLSSLLKSSCLEDYLQDNTLLINCFVKSNYNYFSRSIMSISTIRGFYGLLVGASPYRREIILQNLAVRLRTVPIQDKYEDIPF